MRSLQFCQSPCISKGFSFFLCKMEITPPSLDACYGNSVYIICSSMLVHQNSIYQEQNTLLCREHALGALLDAGDSDVIDMWASPAKSLQMEEKEADKLPITMGKLGNPEVSWVSCPCMLPPGFAFPFYSLLTTRLGFSQVPSSSPSGMDYSSLFLQHPEWQAILGLWMFCFLPWMG